MAQSSSETTSAPSLRICGFGLLIACLLLGFYCGELNKRFYQHHHPFYDSLSYNEKMFRVMTVSRESGFASSLEDACFTNNTNALPFIIGAAIAPIVRPSRIVGIWIQTGLLYLFLLSLLVYLVRIRRVKPTTALAGCLAFLAAKCLFFSNGGLSDFRMDLGLYLGFGMTCVWYLASMARPTISHFLLLGVSASIVCLFRATAPIYLLFSLGPLCAIELIVADKRRQKLMGLVGSTLIVVALAGWFFVINFDFLKYYYVDWNTDANAKIPFHEALGHWKLAQRSVGDPLFLVILCWGIGTMLVTREMESIGTWVSRAWSSRDIDWRIGWLAISPVVLMVARRAGLNAFVCMPAVFGLVLFFTLPCISQMDRLADKRLTRFCWIVLIVGMLLVMSSGWRRHTSYGFNTMAAHHQLIDQMLEDAKLQSAKQLRFGVMHLSDLNSSSLYSTLLFDRPDANPNLQSVEIACVEIIRIHTFSRPAATDWRLLKGDTDEDKISLLLVDANSRIDYLILPDEKTAAEVEIRVAQNHINRYLVTLRNQIVENESWVRVGNPVPTDEQETVEIYRKVR